MTTALDLLAQSPLFASLAPAHREQLALHITRHEYPAGAELFHQGDVGDAMYLLESGAVAVSMRDPRVGIVQQIAMLAPPESFGESALVTGGRRTATCTAVERSVVQRLGRDVFLAVCNQVPAVALGLARSLAERLHTITVERDIAWESLSGRAFDARLWAMVPDHVLRAGKLVPIELSGRTMTVGMVDPHDTASLDHLARALPGLHFKIVAVGADDYQRYVEMGTGKGPAPRSTPRVDSRQPITFLEDDSARTTTGNHVAIATGPQVVALCSDIVSMGLALGASDIHVEQERRGVLVRYRVDGALQPGPQTIPIEAGKPLVSRFKLLAKMDITETRKPQDGRISVRQGQKIIDLRLSTMPAKLGEKVVMRILDAEASITDLKSLFHVDKVRQIFAQMVFRPQGLVMITGPTGSGKTTTLYSALHARRRPELNVVTVEDPIEYHLDGITQVQVNPEIGTTFATVLRALLRQDPNVILVGETRDRETARMAVEASMTGHLVLTSVHTNSAIDAIGRLSDLGVERYAIANGLLGVLHQRLVRRCCSFCAEPFDYPEPIVELLYRAGAFLPNEKPTLMRGRGCVQCNNTGFKGRVGVYELLVATDPIRETIASGADASGLKAATGGGMIDLARYAGILVGTGVTVPGEVLHMVQRMEQ